MSSMVALLAVAWPTAGPAQAAGPAPTSVVASERVTPTPEAALERGRALRSAVEPVRKNGLHYTSASTAGADVRVRWGTTWTPWMHLEGDLDDTPDGEQTARPGGAHLVRTEPVWVGRADAYEITVPADATGVKVHLVRGSGGAAQPAPSSAAAPLVATGSAAPPPILPRSDWGAREEKETPTISTTLNMAIIHHTAVGGQGYSMEDVPAMLQGIQAYHMDGNGWNDIAYNFAVDRFGRIWEARAGGISRAVQGGHAKGFNTRSVGVVVLGDFSTDAISDAAVTAIGDLLGWKLFIHGVDPTATVRRISAGNDRYPEGTAVVLDAITGHGDTGYTSCPGTNLASRLPSIRSRVAGLVAARKGDGTFDARAASQATVSVPLRGDFNGDGRGDVLWYGAGATGDSLWSGAADGTFAIATKTVSGTYEPFVGDFDHDGKTDVFWYGPGAGYDSIWFGTATGFAPVATAVSGTYQPVVGDFDGDLRSDVLWYGPGSDKDSLWLGDSDRSWTYQATTVSGTYEPVVGDFNEDDRHDVLWYGAGTLHDGLWLGDPSGFRVSSAAVSFAGVPLVGDFSGGRGDDVLWYGAGAVADGLWISGTTGGFSSLPVTVSGTYRPVVADVDGGGRDDVLWYGVGTGSDTLWRSNGDGTFATTKPTISLDAVGLGLDGDGDGLDDVLWYGTGSAPDAYWLGVST